MNYIDILVLLLFALSIFLGFKKGFLRTVTGLCALILSLLLATILYPYATKIVMKTPVYDTVYSNVVTVVKMPQKDGESTLSETGKLNLPNEVMKNLDKNVRNASNQAGDVVASKIASVAVKLVSMLCVFFAARLLLFLLSLMAGFIRKLPVIGWGDSLLGGLFGLLRGILLIYILFTVVTFSASVSPNSKFVQDVKQSGFARVMYNNNVLLRSVYKNEFVFDNENQ